MKTRLKAYRLISAAAILAGVILFPASSGAGDPFETPPENYPPQDSNPAAGALDSEGEEGAFTHEGFFLRLALGVGYASSTLKFDGFNASLKGAGVASGLSIGYCVIENLALSVDFYGVTVVNPVYRVQSQELKINNDSYVNWSGFGVGAHYYFMPINLFVGMSLGASVMRQKIWVNDEPAEEIKTDAGFMMQLLVGKEWWVSENWGIGVTGQFHLSSQPLKENADKKWQGLGGALFFSATYN